MVDQGTAPYDYLLNHTTTLPWIPPAVQGNGGKVVGHFSGLLGVGLLNNGRDWGFPDLRP